MKLLFILLPLLFTAGYRPSRLLKKDVLPKMPTKTRSASRSNSPTVKFGEPAEDTLSADEDRAVAVASIKLLSQAGQQPLSFEAAIYSRSASGPPRVDIPEEITELLRALDADEEVSISSLNDAIATLQFLNKKRLDEHSPLYLAHVEKLAMKRNSEFLPSEVHLSSASSGSVDTPAAIFSASFGHDPEIGFAATDINFMYSGKKSFTDTHYREVLNSVKFAATFSKMNDLKSKVKEYIDAVLSRQADAEGLALEQIYTIASDGLPDDIGGLGLLMNAIALASNAIPLYTEVDSDGTALKIRARPPPNSSRRDPFISDAAAKSTADATFEGLLKGQGIDLPRNFVKRVSSTVSTRFFHVHADFELFVHCRKAVQLRIAHCIISVLQTLGTDDTFRLHEECTILSKQISEMLRQQDGVNFHLELDAPITSASVLFALFDPDINSGSRALALVKYLYRERNPGIVDLHETGAIMSKTKILPFETPMAYLYRSVGYGRTKKGVNPNINWPRGGLLLIRVKNGDNIPQITGEQSQSNLVLLDVASERGSDSRFREILTVLTPDVLAKARNFDYTLAEVDALFSLLDAKNIAHTPARPANYVDPGSGGGASVDDSVAFAAALDNTGKKDRGRQKDKKDPSKPQNLKPPRSPSLVPGDATGVQLYQRGVELLGGKTFPNTLPVLELIQSYFLATVKKEPFSRNKGTTQLPLLLNDGFKWKPTDKDSNFNCRRDIYALWAIVRDIMIRKVNPKYPDLLLTALGREYQKIVPSWKSLTAEDFMKLYKPSTSKFNFTPRQIQIKGEKCKEFTA